MASKYIQKFPVPQNFPEILHDLSKEILRNQPEDIIEFSAMYFKCAQEGLVLDYPKKGKNIPCDFKPTVPKIYTKISKMKEISAEDERDHKVAVQASAYINNQVQHGKIKEENKKKDELNFVVHHRDNDENVTDDRPSKNFYNFSYKTTLKKIL